MIVIYEESEKPIKEIICCGCDGGSITIHIIPKSQNTTAVTRLDSNPSLYTMTKQGLDDLIEGLMTARTYIKNRK